MHPIGSTQMLIISIEVAWKNLNGTAPCKFIAEFWHFIEIVRNINHSERHATSTKE